MAMETTTERAGASLGGLTSLLRGEISAVETYRQALEKITDPTIRATLQENLDSHQSRCELLRARIVQLGGKPVEGSGPWGAFAKLVEGGAKLFGEKAAVAALEEGEDHGLRDYRDELNKLDSELRSFVEIQLLPAQERTHRTMSSLKKTIH
jgi:demethoxyubiquinone hydroxylase (CLK1/Coq7/Cat5 family)